MFNVVIISESEYIKIIIDIEYAADSEKPQTIRVLSIWQNNDCQIPKEIQETIYSWGQPELDRCLQISERKATNYVQPKQRFIEHRNIGLGFQWFRNPVFFRQQ